MFFEDIYFENSFSYPLEEEKEIMTCMALKNKCELDEKINKFFHKLFSQSTSDKKVIKSALYSFVGTMIKLCFEKNIILSNSDINQVFEAISKNDKIADVKKVVISFVNLIMDNILKSESKNYIVTKATEYISKNYSQNITLESVAKEVYVTPTYLSILFKRELGINFTDYLHKFRIQKAQEFLKNKALKTYQVANLVGYQDEKYFSQIFKKYTGLSPSQYRESLL